VRLLDKGSKMIKKIISAIEYFLVTIMLISGVQIGIRYDQEITTSAMGQALENPVLLITFSVLFITASLGVLYGKFRKHPRVHTTSLMTFFIVNMFGSIVDALAWGPKAPNWIDTFIVAILFAGIWLFWKAVYEGRVSER
jgi:hypothetical protein